MNLPFREPDSIDAAFAVFDEANPLVYTLFREYAEKARALGFTRFSADMILHRIRWYHAIEKGNRDWAVNNNFSSRYARKLVRDEPGFAGMFEMRKLRA